MQLWNSKSVTFSPPNFLVKEYNPSEPKVTLCKMWQFYHTFWNHTVHKIKVPHILYKWTNMHTKWNQTHTTNIQWLVTWGNSHLHIPRHTAYDKWKLHEKDKIIISYQMIIIHNVIKNYYAKRFIIDKHWLSENLMYDKSQLIPFDTWIIKQWRIW